MRLRLRRYLAAAVAGIQVAVAYAVGRWALGDGPDWALSAWDWGCLLVAAVAGWLAWDRVRALERR